MARKTSKKRRFQADKLMTRMKKSKASMRGSKSIIDMEKVGDTQIWQPKDGEHTIDVTPYLAGSNDPNVKKGEPTYLFPYSQHPRIGAAEEQILCPAATFGNPCPICEDRMKLREQGQDKEVWKPLFPKDRAIYNIVCYDQGEEKKGNQVWDVARFYFENPVLKLAMRKGRGGKSKTGTIFQDPENGKSIVFEIEPAKSKDDFPSYTGIAFEDRDYEIDDDILDQAIALDEIVKVLSYDEIAELYFGGKVESKDEKRKSKDSDDESEERSTDELMEQLEDCEDLDDLDEFIDENDFDIEITKKSRFPKVKRELKKLIIAMEMDDEEEEEEEPEDEQDYTWGELKTMNIRKLKVVIKDEKLDIDPDEAEDTMELREMVADELDIKY